MYLLQNVYTSKESASYIVSNKLFSTMEAAVKERDKAIEDAIVNEYSSYDDDSIDTVDTTLYDKAFICGPDFVDAWFITNLKKLESNISDGSHCSESPHPADS